MSHYKILSGAIAIATLVSFTATVQAQLYNGPRQVDGKCWKTGGTGTGMGYWEACPTTGATANARIARPAPASKTSKKGTPAANQATNQVRSGSDYQ
jgi:hypothetical protein